MGGGSPVLGPPGRHAPGLTIDQSGPCVHIPSERVGLSRWINLIARTLLPKQVEHYWYDHDGTARTIPAVRGVDQGCPLSPLLFALAMAAPPADLKTKLRQDDPAAHVLSYLDDVYVVVSADKAAATLQEVRALFAKIGLELNEAKTQAWTPSPSTRAPAGVRRRSPDETRATIRTPVAIAASPPANTAALGLQDRFQFVGLDAVKGLVVFAQTAPAALVPSTLGTAGQSYIPIKPPIG